MDNQVFINSILVGGGATLIATQVLKSKLIPVQFQKYPRSTAAVLSLVAAIVAEYQAGLTVNIHDTPTLVGLFVGTLWVAISVYNHLQLKSSN